MTAGRLILRVAVCLTTLALVDAGLQRAIPSPTLDANYRLPETLPTSELPQLLAHLDDEAAAEDDAPVVAFIGASPTWGDAVSAGAQTVPAAFARSAVASGVDLRVHNLASNGQLVADEYFVARRAACSADVVFVQITYHSFNGAWRGGTQQRYPELPKLLGVPVGPREAKALGIDPTPRMDITGGADRALRRGWRLYAERDRLAARAVGGSLETRLHDEWESAVAPDFEGERDSGPSAASFDRLEPDAQMLVIDEFSAAARFRFDASDSEAVMLDSLARSLSDDGVRAIFYISPMNRQALESFDLFDAAEYERNAGAIRRLVEARGHTFLDLNDRPLPSAAFADINHTTAAGSEIVGRRLWNATGAEVTRP